VTHVNNLGDNDIYRWYMANSLPDGTLDQPTPPDVKLNLIYPCTDKHVKKYSFQQSRIVLETPEIYAKYVRPYMRRCREEGRLNWVFNILEGREEQGNVLFRSKEADAKDDFMLLPDLNWDRETIGSLHLLALVERRDVWSVRDLRKGDVAWLRHLRAMLTKTVGELYGGVEDDMLKFYVHCTAILSVHPWCTRLLTADHRSANVLSLPHPYRARQSRPDGNASHGQGSESGPCHQSAGHYGWWRRSWHGRCRAHLYSW